MTIAAAPIAADSPELHAALAGARLPTEDLGDGGRTFFRIDSDGRTIGYGGYELYGEDALVRSVVVIPDERGKGYGRHVTEQVLVRAHEAGARTAYLLTTNAEPFFTHLGFTSVPRADAPASILGTRQATSICSTAALLKRPLSPRA